MPTLLAAVLAAAGFALASPDVRAQSWPDAPPNLVQATPTLYTSGQPPAKSLEGLKAQGFEAVVYLAPPTVQDAVRDESRIVGSQGLVFVNIPIVFDNPTERDFETFVAVIKALGTRKVLVHCQVNLRASSMVFLYRTIVGKESAGGRVEGRGEDLDAPRALEAPHRGAAEEARRVLRRLLTAPASPSGPRPP